MVEGNPYSSSQTEVPAPTVGMTLGEMIYTGFVIVGALIVAMSIAAMGFILQDEVAEKPVFQASLAIMAVFFLGLSTTVAVNLVRGRLVPVATVAQVVLLAFTMYLIPLSIAGVVLLVRSRQRETRRGSRAPSTD